MNIIFFYCIGHCFLSGERVEIDKTSEYDGQISECAIVEENICSNSAKQFTLHFASGYENNVKYIDLTPCSKVGKNFFIHLNNKCSKMFKRNLKSANTRVYSSCRMF